MESPTETIVVRSGDRDAVISTVVTEPTMIDGVFELVPSNLGQSPLFLDVRCDVHAQSPFKLFPLSSKRFLCTTQVFPRTFKLGSQGVFPILNSSVQSYRFPAVGPSEAWHGRRDGFPCSFTTRYETCNDFGRSIATDLGPTFVNRSEGKHFDRLVVVRDE